MKLKKIISLGLLALILCFAFFLRRDAFWLPHWKGDQGHYAVLSMKLDLQGLDGYHLREVGLGNKIISTDPKIEFVFFRLLPAGDMGDILRILHVVGQGYYDEPLHYRAPLFSYVLMLSHRLFDGDKKFYALCSSNLAEQVVKIKPKIIMTTQFWAAVVPIFFNLAVILMTFFLGRQFFNDRVGLWASFLMASNPVSLTLAYRLLVEDLLTFLVTLSVFLYLLFFRKKNIFGAFAAGAAAGLAVLAKQTAGLLLPAVWLYTLFSERKSKNIVGIALNPYFLIYALAAVLVSAFWFLKVYQVFGNPIHQPGSVFEGIQNDRTGWFYAVSHRPPPFLFFSVGVIYLSPIFGFALLRLRKFYRHCGGDPMDESGSAEMMLWLWILAFFVFITEPWHVLVLMGDQEHRFFYGAYPAIAILSALGVDSLRLKWSRSTQHRWLPDTAIASLLWVNALWGIPKAMKVIYQNNLLF